MRALIAAAAVLLALFLLMQVRVGCKAEYRAEGFFLWLRLGALRLRILPAGEKPERKDRPPEKRPKRTEKPGKPEPGITPGGALEYARELLPIALEAASRFRRKLRVDRLRLELRLGGDDPGDAAMNYGYANAALGALWLPLTRAFHVVDGTAKVIPDLNGGGTTVYGMASLSLKIGQVLWLGICFGIRGLRAALSVKNKQKLRQAQRKAV